MQKLIFLGWLPLDLGYHMIILLEFFAYVEKRPKNALCTIKFNIIFICYVLTVTTLISALGSMSGT